MVAYDTRSTPDPDRRLSADVASALREALVAHWAAPATPAAPLSTAVGAAARDAAARSLRPEELLISLKEIEEEVAASIRALDVLQRRALREWMATACLRAYFDERRARDGA